MKVEVKPQTSRDATCNFCGSKHRLTEILSDSQPRLSITLCGRCIHKLHYHSTIK